MALRGSTRFTPSELLPPAVTKRCQVLAQVLVEDVISVTQTQDRPHSADDIAALVSDHSFSDPVFRP
jgi:hypothetical protein